ncbi:phage tail tape measure protein [Ligilactobacillus pobuzihii]|uniref:phage tail tape measure protein n=1 Tax=Ligilactobacillus pobuzihii TaxID=449659 RepID=UPI0019D1F476|nr:phage tail tape measure protein [Ligilactobacillus pobuzihii]MBN7275503.1 phage tail tape measure protein [Ligilactobacillus pobuzihii]
MERIQGYRFGIDLDDGGMARTMKELRDEAKMLKGEMRANFGEIRSGEGVMAAYSQKIKDAERAIDGQKAVIQKAKKEQEGLDLETQEGREAYQKYERQINTARQSISSLEGQQARASQALKQHNTVLTDLKRSYKENNEVSKSYVERLKAEGKGASATVSEYHSLRSSLKSLKSQYDIQEKEQGQLGEKVKSTRAAYKEQEAVVKRVASEHGKTSKEYREAKSRLNQLDNEVKESESAFKKQSVRVNETGKEMAETKNKTKSMQHEISRLHPTGIKRIDNAVVRVKDHTGHMATKAKESFAKFRSAAVGASVGVGILSAGMLQGAKMASTLQNTYNENTNLLVTSGEKTKAVTAEIAAMQKDGRKYSVQYGESQKNIASGYQELVKRGYDGKQSLGAMKSILQASKASGDDFSDTMQVTTSTLEAFGMRTKSTSGMMRNTKKVANELAMAADATSTDFKSLGVGMNYVGTSAHTAGLSLGDTASAMGVLSNSGLEAQQAGTGLRKILISLMTPTKGGASAFKKYGMSIDDFKDKSGKLKPVGDIFAEIGKKVPKGEQANFFHNVFGTTGQNAAAILATNTSELKKVNAQVGESYHNNYVGKLADKNMKSTQNSVKQFKEAAKAVEIEMGTAMMPALSKAAKGMSDAFDDPDVQKGLKVIASGIGTVADKAVDFVIWLGKHHHDVKIFGEVMLAAFAGKKLVNGISWLTESMANIKGLFGSISKSAGKGAISGEMTGVARSAKSANIESGAMLGTVKKMPAAFKAVSAGMAALPAAIDLGSSIANTINTPSSKNKIALASKTLGAGVGGLAGFAIGGPIGAGIGATIGDQLGSSKTGQSIVGKLSKSINKAMKGTKIKAPKMDSKDAEKSIKQAAKKYKDQQLKDLKFLHDTGNISDKEYKRRVKAVNDSYGQQKKSIEKGEKSNNVVAKYYAKQKQKIDTSYNKERKRVHNKYQTETDKAERTFGKKSVQYQKAKHRQEKAEDNVASKHKKAISKLNQKYATQDMTGEAKAHMTLAGKIKSSSKRQEKTLKNLRNKKKKYSQSALKKIVADSNKEYKTTVSNANKRYNKIAKAADKQRAKVATAADRQYKAAKKAAENQYKKTVDAANRQYKGHGKAAEKQRKDVIKKAKDQKNKSIDSAENQRKKTVEKADRQRADTVDKAEKQRQTVTSKAGKQRDDVKAAAKDQGYHVAKSHTKQANDSMKASKSQATGMQSIWNSITGWWSSFLKAVGVKSPKEHHASYDYTSATYPNMSKYDTGGSVTQTGKALVGEAGPELRYTPYSGKVDILGQSGAEFADVKAGQQILNATDTKKMLTGQFQGSLPGYVKGTISLGGFFKKVKDGAEDIFDNISDSVSDMFDKVKDPLKTVKKIASKAFDLDKVKHLGSYPRKYSKGMVKKLISGIVDKFNEIKDAIASAMDGGSFDGKIWHGGPANANGVYAYLVKIAKKAMKRFGGMHFSSGYRPGDRYYHGKRQAIDIAFDASRNGTPEYRKVGDWVFDKFKKQIGYVITLNKVRDRSGDSGTGRHNGWTNWAEGGHMDHLHINGMWGPDDVGSGSGKVQGSHKSLLKRAGFRSSEIAAANWIVDKESSWNPNAVNPTSGAFGLAQSLGHGMAGHGSPLAQLKWMAGYIHGRYGTANSAKRFHQTHNWYANGDIVDHEQYAHIAEGNLPESIVPWDLSKRSRAYKIMQTTMDHFAKTDNVGPQQPANLYEENQLLKKINQSLLTTVDLLKQVVEVGHDQVNATHGVKGYDPIEAYKKRGSDQSLFDWQSLGGVQNI